MPRFYTTDGAIYDLSRDQAQDLQDMWNVHGGELTAVWAAREFADYQMAPPTTTDPQNGEALQRINAALGRLAEPRPDLAQEDLTDLELRTAVARIDGDMVFQTPITRANTAYRWQQLFDDHQVEKEMEKLKPLTYPLTPEVNPDGVKRLFKTRYQELESMYSDLHYKYNKATANISVQSKMYQDLNSKYQVQNLELQKVKANFVDGEVVSKRLHQICKEVGIPVPNERLSMQQQMDAFLGSVMSMIRVDLEGLDELAE